MLTAMAIDLELFFGGVLLTEALNATGGIHKALLAGVERVANCTNFNVERLAHGRTCGKRITTAAGDLNFVVFGMRTGFHDA
jgi:hypothetical protein